MGIGIMKHRKDGRWEIRVTVCKKNGKSAQYSVYGRTPEEAIAKRDAFIESNMKEVLAENHQREDIVYYKFLAKFKKMKRPVLKASSFRQYELMIDKHIQPYLGSLKLSEITTASIERFASTVLQFGWRDTESEMAPKSVETMVSIVYQTIRVARKAGFRVADEFCEPTI